MLCQTGSGILLLLTSDNSKLETEEDEIWGGLSPKFVLELVVVFRVGFVEVRFEFGGIFKVEYRGTRGGSSSSIGVVSWGQVEGPGDSG